MERKGSKDRKSKHKSEEVDSDKEESNDEMDKPETSTGKKETPKRELRSSKKGNTEKVSPKPTDNPNLEVKVERGHRKRPASSPDVSDPKKPSLGLETKSTPTKVQPASGSRKRQASPLVVTEPKKPALHSGTAQDPAGTDAPDALMLDFQKLDINRSGRDTTPQGGSQREILVHRDGSGYVNVQAAFHDPSEADPDEMGESAAGGSGEGAAGGSGEGAAGGSGEGASGGSGEGASGGSGEGASGGSGEGAAGGSGEGAAGGSGEVGAGGNRESFPRLIIPIYWIQAMFAGIVARYNETIPIVMEELAHYTDIVEAIRDYEDQLGGDYYTLLFQVAPHVRNLMESESSKRERIRAALEENILRMQEEINRCTTIAETVMRIFSAEETSPFPTQLNENPRQYMCDLDNSLVLLDTFRDLCKIQANEFNKLRYSMNEEVPWSLG